MSYFDTLAPLPQREAKCEDWGFKCKCRRCILKHSVRTALKSLNVLYEQLHDKAMVKSIPHQQRLNVDLPISAEFANLFVKVEEIIRSSPDLKTGEEKNWIRASYVGAYLKGTQSDEFLLAMLENRIQGNSGGHPEHCAR